MRTILAAAFAVILGLTSAAPRLFAEETMGGPAVHCPTCGFEMPASFHFCSNCGTNLENAPSDVVPATASTTTTTSTEEHGAAAVITSTTTTTKKKTFHFSDLFNPGGGHGSALSDQPAPLQIADFPQRPKPIIEIGLSPFLGQGPIKPGYVMPTGAVWQPDFIVYGTARTALQTFDDGTGQITEFATRLDLYGNLYLTPTERILIGFRPLDRDGLDYTGYRFDPPEQEVKPEFNAYITTLFFQGDFGELFPNLDPNDDKSLDFSFAVGRQPLSFQDGIMINEDMIDAIGITRTSLFYLGASALRSTAIFAWNELNRNDNRRDSSAKLFGFFNSLDYANFDLDVDFAYVNADDRSGGDGAYLGVGVVQRFGLINSTTRVNGSLALEDETAAVSDGVLLTQQFSTLLPDGENLVYFDAFLGIGDYASAARGYDRGGPLGQVGLLFAAQGLGSYGAPLGNRANDAVGAAIGYQMFWHEKVHQLTFELGGRVHTDDPTFFGESQPDAIAAAGRYQMKLNQHMVMIFDTFVGFPEARSTAYGFRSELLIKF